MSYPSLRPLAFAVSHIPYLPAPNTLLRPITRSFGSSSVRRQGPVENGSSSSSSPSSSSSASSSSTNSEGSTPKPSTQPRGANLFSLIDSDAFARTNPKPKSTQPESLLSLIDGLASNLSPPSSSSSSSSSKPIDDYTWYPSTLPPPGNQFSGRSIPIFTRPSSPFGGGGGGRAPPGSAPDFISAYRRLSSVLARNKIKPELRLAAFFEKGSVRRRRLAMERHRRRFQALVREKVQLVQTIKNRQM